MSTLTLSLSNLHMSMSHLPSPPLSPVSCASTSSASHSHPSMSMSMDHSGHSSQSVSHASTPGFRSRNLSPYSSFHMCEVDTHTTSTSTSTCYASSSSSSSSPLPAPSPIIDVDSDEAVEVGSPQHAAHVIAAANAKASARRLSLDRKQSPLLSFLPSPAPPSPMNETKVLTPTSPLKHVTLKSVPITPTHSSSRSSLSSQYPTLHPRYIVTDNKHVPVIQTSLYGTVIRAWDTLCQCPVAIKISSRSLLSIHLSTEGEPILEDVRNECLHMTHLHGEMPTQHVFDAQRWHHVVPLLDQRQDSQYHYLVTPFYNGSDLFTYLTSQPNCRLANDDHIHYLFTQLIDATQHLHSHGLAHRDITLENVLLHVNDEGTHVDLHLIDLGVAVSKPSNSEDDDMHFSCAPLPENALKPGKIEYMSPELLSHEPWDAFANDVFSLGTILYQMAVGQPPFDAADDACADYILSGTWKRHLRPLYRLETPPCMEYAYDEEWTPRHDHIDPYLLDLITHLLCPQSQRYTIQQIQQHVWVRGED